MTTRPTAAEIRRKVLLVDDDALSLELASLLLAHEGHEVERASGAEAALELLSSAPAGRPDVLLVDLQMPGVSGGQLAERIRAMQGPEPLLLAMSATEVQRQQLVAFDDFLLKPLALEELRRALRRKKLRSYAAERPRESRRGKPRKASLMSPGEQGPEQVLDPAITRKLLAMMPVEAWRDVITACVADTRSNVEVLREQWKSRNAQLASQSAHRIKGAALMIGASRMARLAGGLEAEAASAAADPLAGARWAAGGNKEEATLTVFDELLRACAELEGMLLSSKFMHT